MASQFAAPLAHFFLLGIPKTVLSLGGIVLIGWGLFTGPDWSRALWGIAAVVVGQLLHRLDVSILDRKLVVLAEAAARGVGPVAPREVRKALVPEAANMRGVHFDEAFSRLCASWSEEAGAAGLRR